MVAERRFSMTDLLLYEVYMGSTTEINMTLKHIIHLYSTLSTTALLHHGRR